MQSQEERPNRKRIRYKYTRDGVLFFAGLGGVAHETFFSQTERPILLGVFMTMMGLPFFIRIDENRRDG